MKTIVILFLMTFFNIKAQSIIINEIMSSNSSIIQDEDGDYSDWIELYNPTESIVNLMEYSLSDDVNNPRKWLFPDVSLLPNSYLLIFASGKNKTIQELHTNFKISSSGEQLLLVNNFGVTIDQLEPVFIPSNISFGRSVGNQSEWVFYSVPTPWTENNPIGYSALSEAPSFSTLGGFYSSEQSITLSTLSEAATIYYTLDGSDPMESSLEYTSPISITETKVLRAKTYEAGLLPSKIITHTYLINETTTLPVISLSTNPDNFFDDEIGIYPKLCIRVADRRIKITNLLEDSIHPRPSLCG